VFFFAGRLGEFLLFLHFLFNNNKSKKKHYPIRALLHQCGLDIEDRAEVVALASLILGLYKKGIFSEASIKKNI
jgi:hypothetical protein